MRTPKSKRETDAQDKKLKALQMQNTQLKAANEENTTAIAGLQKRLENLTSTNSVLRASLTSKSREAVQLKEQLSNAKKALAEGGGGSEDADELREELTRYKEEAATLRSKLQERRRDQAGPSSSRAAGYGRSSSAAHDEEEVQELREDKQRLEAELERMTHEREWLNQRLNEQQDAALQDPEARTRALRAALKKAKADLEDEQRASEESTKQLDAARKKVGSRIRQGVACIPPLLGTDANEESADNRIGNMFCEEFLVNFHILEEFR